jgi:predicted kinase
MSKPTLYLFIGYPGAGKTTIAKLIAETTGAKHIWADVVRHKLFPKPTHSKEESDELYKQLNEATDYLLSRGKSVVFDTNFNRLADRKHLRKIAKNQNAETQIIWVTTSEKIAKERAVKSHKSRNLYDMNMSEERFNTIVSKLEPPLKSEPVIKIDDGRLNKGDIKKLLKLT